MLVINHHALSSRLLASKALPRAWRAAFSLMELMVAIAILIVIILSVGVIFGGASRSVSNSQALLEMMASIRATQAQIERDVAGIDKSTFLVIRSRLNRSPAPAPGYPLHFDQVAFISLGSFINRTGANDALSPFSDNSTANAAHVWYGQLVMEHASPPDASYATANQAGKLPLDAPPTGLLGTFPNYTVNEKEFVLGRHITLLFPGPADGSGNVFPAGRPVPAYPGLQHSVLAISAAGETDADITSSRFTAVAASPAQIMRLIVQGQLAGNQFVEVQNFCYRYKALNSPYDTEITQNSFVNGYFRQNPIMLGGVSSFAVEWTNGAMDVNGNLEWFGATNFSNDPAIEQGPIQLANGDQYTATFNNTNRSKWPKALRFSYHVVEPNNRLQGGRDFVQVVKLPE